MSADGRAPSGTTQSVVGRSWGSPAARGAFPDDAQQQEILFKTPQTGRFVRLVALTEVSGHPFTSVAELDVIPAQPLEEKSP